MAAHIRYSALTECERDVLRSFASGELLSFSDTGEDREVRGAFLSGLLTGLYPVRATGIPALRLAGARVTGRLDLESAQVRHLIDLRDCRFDEVVDLQMASVIGLRMIGCRVPGLSGRNLYVGSDLVLEDGFHSEDVVDLTDGEVRGTLRLTRAVLRGRTKHALLAARLKISGSLEASRLRANGEVRLRGAQIGGSLHLSGARLANSRGVALEGTGLVVTGNLFCDPKDVRFAARGRLLLTGAQVGGDAVFSGAHLATEVSDQGASVLASGLLDSNAALVADRIRVQGNLELNDDLRVVGSVRIPSAQIGGHLHLSGAVLGRPASVAGMPKGDDAMSNSQNVPVALLADGARIQGDLDARTKVGARNGNDTAMTAYGQVRLVDASISGNARLSGGRLHGQGLDVLFADRITVGGSFFLQYLYVQGSVRLQNAQIGSSLDCTGARLVLPRRRSDRSYKPSLDIRAAVIGKDLLCSRGFTATGGVRIRLVEAGKLVSFDNALLGLATAADSEGTLVALNAYGLTAVRLTVRFETPPMGKVILRRARVASMSDGPELWDAAGGVDLEEFAFEAISARPAVTVKTRLRWLRRVVESYAPSPYEQLARAYRESGDDEQADRVLLAKQQRRFASLGPLGRVWGWLQEFTVGFGYRPWLAGWWLVALWLGGTWWFSEHKLIELDEGQRPVWSPVLLSADLLLPVINLGQDNMWRIDGTSQWVSSLLIAAGWILASTAAAGTTRVLKRS